VRCISYTAVCAFIPSFAVNHLDRRRGTAALASHTIARTHTCSACPPLVAWALDAVFTYLGAGLGLCAPALGIRAFPQGGCVVLTSPAVSHRYGRTGGCVCASVLVCAHDGRARHFHSSGGASASLSQPQDGRSLEAN
jgi:hypothetical protein